MKKVLLALTLVALMASVAFAAIPVKLECIGLLGGNSALVNSANGTITLGPVAATAVSFGVTDAVSLGIGIINVSENSDWVFLNSGAGYGPGDEAAAQSVMGIYLNGFYKLMSMGAISHSIGLEVALLSATVDDGSGTSGTVAASASKIVLLGDQRQRSSERSASSRMSSSSLQEVPCWMEPRPVRQPHCLITQRLVCQSR